MVVAAATAACIAGFSSWQRVGVFDWLVAGVDSSRGGQLWAFSPLVIAGWCAAAALLTIVWMLVGGRLHTGSNWLVLTVVAGVDVLLLQTSGWYSGIVVAHLGVAPAALLTALAVAAWCGSLMLAARSLADNTSGGISALKTK